MHEDQLTFCQLLKSTISDAKNSQKFQKKKRKIFRKKDRKKKIVLINLMSNKELLDNIKKLRELTGVGFKDCKIALDETSGDLEKSVEF